MLKMLSTANLRQSSRWINYLLSTICGGFFLLVIVCVVVLGVGWLSARPLSLTWKWAQHKFHRLMERS